ncbi:hypothetical protein Zm00014a_019972, partial [Zea mays]
LGPVRFVLKSTWIEGSTSLNPSQSTPIPLSSHGFGMKHDAAGSALHFLARFGSTRRRR